MIECIKFLKEYKIKLTAIHPREFPIVPSGAQLSLYSIINDYDMYIRNRRQLRHLKLMYLEQCTNHKSNRLKSWLEIQGNRPVISVPKWYNQVQMNWQDLDPTLNQSLYSNPFNPLEDRKSVV